jgi:hypothetical protein
MGELKTASSEDSRYRLLPAISRCTVIAILSANDPMAAVADLCKEQPVLVEAIDCGWLPSEREAAIWAAALCYTAIKRELAPNKME